MNAVFQTLHSVTETRNETASEEDAKPFVFASLQPESHPDLLKKYNLATVPTFLYFAHKRLVRRTAGANAALLQQNVNWLMDSSVDELLSGACEVISNIEHVVVLMKGTPSEPKCGFSRQVVEILRRNGVTFGSFDVLSDTVVREAMKRHADWPTYPMVFAGGELIGGVDIIRELDDNKQLVEQLSGSVETAKVEVVKPIATKPKEDVPVATGATHVEANGLDDELRMRLSELVVRDKVMLFMKGNPDTPRCGFSRRIVELLRNQEVTYGHFDILGDNDVRQGLKKFSEWPTFPQLYANGKFLGGLDIVQDMAEAGELKTEMGL